MPVYSTNICRYRRLGDLAWVQMYLNGDGGAEGAGSGQINLALPIAVSSNALILTVNAGVGRDGVSDRIIYADIVPGATTIAISYVNTTSLISSLKGSDQANTTRAIRIEFWYEI